jgi:hypothetical protein
MAKPMPIEPPEREKIAGAVLLGARGHVSSECGQDRFGGAQDDVELRLL